MRTKRFDPVYCLGPTHVHILFKLKDNFRINFMLSAKFFHVFQKCRLNEIPFEIPAVIRK